MARKPFVLRVDEKLLDELKHWADVDLRSLNAQIEWLLRQALVQRGRMKGNRQDSLNDGEDTN